MDLRTSFATIAAFLLTLVGNAAAHPLGNFSISQYSAIHIAKQEVELRYIVDLAEIPTFQEIQETGLMAKPDDASAQTYAVRKAESLRAGLRLEVNGKPIELRAESQEIIFPEGAGGLPTLKLGMVYKAKLAVDTSGAYALNYRDGNFPGRPGWKEIIVSAAPGVTLVSSSVPETDRSARLSDYPTDLLNSPPQQLTAQLSFSLPMVAAAVASSNPAVMPAVVKSEVKSSSLAGSTKAASEPAAVAEAVKDSTANNSLLLTANSQATPRNAFTEIMAQKELSVGIILAALAIAVGLGAFHALEPGHGKTLVAAYLVGSHGTIKHAVLLGLIVTAAHTAGVYLLGGITLYASRYIVPERLYPWLGALSGIMIAALGLVLLVRRYQGKEGLLGSSHHHGHEHEHEHNREHDHGQQHHHGGHGHHHHHADEKVSLKQLFALGISGGIVPCPAALVVLLGALAMQRVSFGLLLIVAFSFGLAAVLIAIGMLMVYARQFMARFRGDGLLTTRWLPLASSAFIFVIGLTLTFQALRGTENFLRL